MRVLDGLYAAIYVTDDDDRVLFANRRLARLMDAGTRVPAAAEIAGRFVPAKAEGAVGDHSNAEFHFAGSEARDATDGRWYILQTGRIPWVNRERVRLHVLTDVTDQKLAQAMRDEHQAALHHTTRLISMAETATTLAHELNQPLIAIVGYNAACLRMLEAETVDTSAVAAAMSKCRDQAVRAGAIVRRLRELARRRAPHLAPCDLNAMVRQQVAWAENDLERAAVRVELALAEPLPKVPADRILVEQVIVNLVQNALDAMRECPPSCRVLRIETCAGPRGGAGHYGARPRHRHRTGSGRTPVLDIFHHQDLGSRSRLEHLPVRCRNPRRSHRAHGQRRRRDRLPLHPTGKSSMNAHSDFTIYIVDDDEAVRDALSMMLRAAGRTVETFATAEEFIERRSGATSGCLVLDVRMPGMSGIELQDWLAEHRCALPVLFLTGHGNVPMAVRAIKHGAFDFLEKPIDDARLLAAIDDAVAAAANSSSLPPAVATLTRREREVLDLILAGRQTRAIAEALFISIKTVEFHRSRIHAKLKVSSMAELFTLCLGHAKSRAA